MVRWRFLILSLFLLSVVAVNANEQAIKPYTPEEIAERARKRLYAGGSDEEDLRVMESMPEATQKTTARDIQKSVLGELIKDEPETTSEDGE